MRRRLTSAAATLAATVALAVACQSLSTDPDEIVSIDFQLPFPAVVMGDTLRDATGAAVRLTASLFDADGNPAETDSVDFVSPENLLAISPDGFVTARDDTTGTARIFALAAGLQSQPRQLQVVPPPNRLVVTATPDTLRFLIPDDPNANKSGNATVTVQHFDATTSTATGVPRWLVSFRLEFRGAPIDPADTSVVFLLDPRAVPTDTTDQSGAVTRQVRYRVSGDVVPLDSIILIAEARYKGTLVSGAPARIVIPVKPR